MEVLIISSLLLICLFMALESTTYICIILILLHSWLDQNPWALNTGPHLWSGLQHIWSPLSRIWTQYRIRAHGVKIHNILLLRSWNIVTFLPFLRLVWSAFPCNLLDTSILPINYNFKWVLTIFVQPWNFQMKNTSFACFFQFSFQYLWHLFSQNAKR